MRSGHQEREAVAMTWPAADLGHPGYQEIVERLRAEIATGRRRPGERLPPVRELARELGVNVNTVARAYSELARDGAVRSRRGGGTFVTAGVDDVALAERRGERLRALLGEAVLQALSLGYTPAQVEAAVQGQLGRWSAATRQAGAPVPPPARPGSLTFVGSHDLALELLAARLRREEPPVELSLKFAGSLAGLMALLLGEAEMAGCHLHDESGDDNAPHVRRLLPGQRVLLLTVARRQQGLILPNGNPRGIRSVGELARPGLVLANRQAGSGTRMLLERELQRAGVAPDAIEQQVYSTHAEVAAAVAEGAADVGIGILAAARTYGLELVPLDWERYELAIPERYVDRPAVRALIGVVESADFRSLVRELGGYDTGPTGERRWVG
jgi:molybdate-binding protein/DNA-binding transcriptional regulator YhcF (GntR family)